ncbi:MAG: N-6 DNA methylase [Candidatus Aenigmarchaeota archaeon]|nr:N-6 DNA methylase [Candidatus Aenigmarchaeota archaeon]
MTNGETEKRLWDIADNLRANSKLSSAEYSTPVLGLVFLRHADFKFTKKQKELEGKRQGSRRQVGKLDYQAEGVLYLPEKARYSYLLGLSEGSDIGQAIDSAMDSIEEANPDLKGTLPRGYSKFTNDLLVTLLKAFSPDKLAVTEGDAFGKIYEYFLGKFAMKEGQKGGEFFTPTSLVKLIVEVIEPFHGKLLDPACGSGGMFVQSAHFVEERKKNPSEELSIYGQERVTGTVKLCKMNLAVHGLSGDIREANTYYEDVHKVVGKFDFVMANPPFNVDRVDYEKVKGDARWPFGLPSTDNANYLWIQLFYSALNEKGRAGFVMANSAADARGAEAEIRKKLIQQNAIDVMIAISGNFFYTVTLPCTLWFLDKNKAKTDRKGKILFIDARNIFKQIDRAHREFTPEQIDQIAGIVRSYRKENGAKKYKDVQGLCKITSFAEIEEQGWSLNPGRYVGVTEQKEDDYDFKEKLEEMNEELEELNEEAHKLEEQISENVNKLLENENV